MGERYLGRLFDRCLSGIEESTAGLARERTPKLLELVERSAAVKPVHVYACAFEIRWS